MAPFKQPVLRFADALRRRKRVLFAATLLILFLSYAVLLFRHTCFVAGDSDSSGYLNAARMFTRGELIRSVPLLDELELPDDWLGVFTPLGFTPGPRPRSIVPFYPPGVPLLMAAAAQIGGWSYAPFLVSPVAALLCLILLYALSREFQLTRASAFAASIILALCPTFLLIAILPYSDVVATLCSLLIILYCLRSARDARMAAAAGAAFAAGLIVRPANMLMLVPILFALPLKPKHLLLFIAGCVPFAILLLSLNGYMYGSALRTGYGSISYLMAWSNFPARFRHYTTQSLLQLSPLVPLAWVSVMTRSAVPLRRRLILLSWPAAFLCFYSFYSPYEEWWYLRFLLPSLPALIIGALLLWEGVARALRRVRPRMAAILGVVLLLTVAFLQSRQERSHGVMGIKKSDERYVEAATHAKQNLPGDAIVACMQMSGSLYYYTNLRLVRWDLLNAKEHRAETLYTELRGRGFQLYALLFPFEVEDAQRQLPGEWEKLEDISGITLWMIKPAKGQ